MALETPIAFCIFNRPAVTQRVFEVIARAKPRRLLVIGDGARCDRPDEACLVSQTREIVENVSWNCDVQVNYAAQNMGCKKRIASGLDWAFQQSDELIILEDDCLPDLSFFSYCSELLARYRNDDRVMMISGDNFQPKQRTHNSYYFSRWAHIWGWASWRRAWEHFDMEIATWPLAKANHTLRAAFSSDEEYRDWEPLLDRQHAGEIDTWDFPWQYACWSNHGLSIIPEKNLISNIGFGRDATHTLDPASHLANRPTTAIDELVHPAFVLPNYEADQHTLEQIFGPMLSPKSPPPKPKWYRRLMPSRKVA
jgi:hypothetical protein